MTGRKPVTFLAPSESLAQALSDTSLQRLQRLKDALDPNGVIRGNFALPDGEATASKNFDHVE